MAITPLENFVDDFEVKTSTKNQPSVRFVRIFYSCLKADFEKKSSTKFSKGVIAML